MAKTPSKIKKTKASTTLRKKLKEPLKKGVTQKKEKFDTTAFVFDTQLSDIEAAMERLQKKYEDQNQDHLTKDETYWYAYWVLHLPEAKRRGMTSVPTCAIENRVLGLPRKHKGVK